MLSAGAEASFTKSALFSTSNLFPVNGFFASEITSFVANAGVSALVIKVISVFIEPELEKSFTIRVAVKLSLSIGISGVCSKSPVLKLVP